MIKISFLFSFSQFSGLLFYSSFILFSSESRIVLQAKYLHKNVRLQFSNTTIGCIVRLHHFNVADISTFKVTLGGTHMIIFYRIIRSLHLVHSLQNFQLEFMTEQDQITFNNSNLRTLTNELKIVHQTSLCDSHSLESQASNFWKIEKVYVIVLNSQCYCRFTDFPVTCTMESIVTFMRNEMQLFCSKKSALGYVNHVSHALSNLASLKSYSLECLILVSAVLT